MPYKDLDKKRETLRRYREKNRERIRLNQAAYRERHKELINERMRELYPSYKEKKKQHYEENREKYLTLLKEWKGKNQDHVRAYNRKYSAQQKENLSWLYVAKLIARHSSLAFVDIPPSLIEAKAAHIKLLRALKGASK